MLKTIIFGITISILLLSSCKEDPKQYAEIKNLMDFKTGEWINDKDSLSGISIRKGMLAFFENMQAPGDSIYDYRVVDFISILGNRKEKIGTYLKKMNLRDTLYVELIEFTDSTITLKKNNDIEIYRLK